MHLVEKMYKEFSKDFYINFFYALGNNDYKAKLLGENKNLVLEQYGLIPHLDDYCNILYNYVKNEIVKKNFKITLIENIFKDIPNVFFRQPSFVIDYTPSNEHHYYGKYSPMLNEFNFNKSTKKFNLLQINMKFSCNEYELYSLLKKTFAHELTHAYEDWQRCCHEASGIMTKEYERLDLHHPNPFFKTTIDILYHLTDFESRAYIATFYAELEDKVNKTENLTKKKIFQLVKDSPIYSHYMKIFNAYMKLKSPNAPEEMKQIFFDSYSQVLNKNFQNYEAVISDLGRRINESWYQFRNNASKIAYDLYIKKRPQLIPNSNDEEETLTDFLKSLDNNKK